MGIAKVGWPVSDPAAPFNTATQMGETTSAPNYFFGRWQADRQIPTAQQYNFLVETTGNGYMNQSYRFDSRATSIVYWENLSGNNPHYPLGRENPLLIGTDCLCMQNAVSVTNAFQWLPVNHTIGQYDGVELSGTAMYHVDGTNCYKTADVTQHSEAVWTTQGAVNWTSAAGSLPRINLIKSGSRLIATRLNDLGSGRNLNDEMEIRISDDDGATWTQKHRQINFDFYQTAHRIQLTAANTLIVVEEEDTTPIADPQDPRFVRYDSTDNGNTWTRTASTNDRVPAGFLALSSGTFLATDANEIWRSTDLGDTWTSVYSAYRVGKYFAEDFTNFVGEVNCFSKFNDGTLNYLYSDDDGATWTESAVTTDGSTTILLVGDYTPHIFKTYTW